MVLAAPAFATPKRALFDNSHAETAGNADWVIDDNQPVPDPPQSGITWASAENFWLGANSAWGVMLVKRGYTVHTLTSSYGITYQNTGNPYDLSNYDVFIVNEPNTRFTSAESTAIFNYVRDGGGLVAVSDHDISDRNNDGFDSPRIWDRLDAQHRWGFHADTTGEPDNNFTQTTTNVDPAPGDSVIHGLVGTANSFAFHNGTSFTLYPAANASVHGDIYMTGTAIGSTTGAMALHSNYGSGRVFIAGDSSPADDGSANPGNSSIFNGWAESGGSDSLVFLNATLWATRRDATGDTQAPTITVTSPNGAEDWKANSPHAITWTATDNTGVTSVDIAWSADGGATYPNPIAGGLANSGSFSWTLPGTMTSTARVRITARDAANHSGSDASDANFTVGLWTVTASAGAGGGISPSGAIGVAQDATPAFTITASPGFHIADVLVDTGSVGAASSYTFPPVTADHTLSASFAADPTWTLATVAVGQGSVGRSPDLAGYPDGASVQLTATPGAGWVFSGWSGDASGSTNPLTLALHANTSVTATFVDATAPSVTVTAPNGGEIWDLGTTPIVTWTAGDNVGVDSVMIEVSLDGIDGPWSVVASGWPNTGSYDWTLPLFPSSRALIRVTAWDAALASASDASDSLFRLRDPSLGVAGHDRSVLELAAPAPNPARGGTMLRFSLASAAAIRLEVLDLAGRRVWAHAGEYDAGGHAVRWDGVGSRSERPGAGLYFVRLVTPAGTRLQRLVLMP